MKQIELAQKSKMSAKHVSDLKTGKKDMSIRVARVFFGVTGIPIRQWLLPNEFGDPWVELKKL